MTQYKPCRKCLGVLTLMIILVTLTLIALSSYFFSFIPMFMKILNIIFIAAALFLTLIYLPVYFKNLCYYVSDEKITKTSGFFFVKTQTIMLDSIQYTTSVTTMFSEKTGLNFFLLYAYGGIMIVTFLNDNDYNLLNCRLRK